MNKKNLLLVFAAIVVIVIMVIVPKSSNFFSTAGGGWNLKNMNQKDTTSMTANVCLQANQTTKQNLEQGLFIGNYFARRNGWFVGAGAVAGVSTQYGVCCPTMYLNTGMDFNAFSIEYRVGKFKRSSILSDGIDPQYSNFCIDLGEGAGAANAMQLSLMTKAGIKFGFGHQGVASFYDFNGGKWYSYVETPVCKGFTLTGGVDFVENVTGYAAAKLSLRDNKVSLTANSLGTETQNIIATYNRNNIRIKDNNMMFSVSAWAQKAEQGLHFVAGLIKGKGTFYAQLGSNFCENGVTPYCGLGTSFNF